MKSSLLQFAILIFIFMSNLYRDKGYMYISKKKRKYNFYYPKMSNYSDVSTNKNCQKLSFAFNIYRW